MSIVLLILPRLEVSSPVVDVFESLAYPAAAVPLERALDRFLVACFTQANTCCPGFKADQKDSSISHSSPSSSSLIFKTTSGEAVDVDADEETPSLSEAMEKSDVKSEQEIMILRSGPDSG